MKIAFIVSHFPVLSETFILNEITGLLDRGHEVDIYAHSPMNDPAIHGDVKKYNLLERTYYMNLAGAIPRNKLVRVLGGLARVVTNLHKDPVAILNAFNVQKYGKEAASLVLLYRISPFLRNGPYDIVHSQFGPNGNLAISLKNEGAFHSKIITTFRGFDLSSYVKLKGSHIYDELFEQGDLFLCVSERFKEKLIQLGCPECKILVHRSGVDVKKFEFISREATSNGKVRLLTIARLVEKKGVQFGIRAVAKILRKYRDIEYRVAGDGPLRDNLERLIINQAVGDKVKLIGWKSQEEIVELLRQTDILITPSVTGEDGDEEGIPGVLREALARGLPVVSTQHSGIPELVQDSVSGFLVRERDVDALAEKLEYLIQHREIWPEMGKAGRSFVARHYDINLLNDRLVGIYGQLLAGEIPDPRMVRHSHHSKQTPSLLLRRGLGK